MYMQQQRDTGTLLGDQHYKKPPYGTQGQGQQITKEQSNLQIQMPTYKLSRRIYGRI